MPKRRVLYLTMVRSLFEHCPIVWRPASNNIVEKLECLQKRAFKWIMNDDYVSYSCGPLYYIDCKQLNILPIKYRFDYHDLKFFHLVVQGFSCIKLPAYLQYFSGNRLRSSRLDNKCFVSTILPLGQGNVSTTRRGFSNSYFFRTHLMWNRLPFDTREIIRPSVFKEKLLKFIWRNLVGNDGDSDMNSPVLPNVDVDR